MDRVKEYWPLWGSDVAMAKRKRYILMSSYLKLAII